MLDGLVGDRELAQVVANHLRLDLHIDVLLAVVDTNHAANHLGNNDHVAFAAWPLLTSLGKLSLFLHQDSCNRLKV